MQLAKSHPHPKPALANELTLQLANPVYSNGIYEFDVNIKANTNSTYLDNVPVHITYNTAVFNSNIVSASNVTVTNGNDFNNPNYYPANSYITDYSSNVFAFAVGAIVNKPVRTQITTTYKHLAHVKMQVSNCGNVNIDLTNANIAINVALYTPTPTGSNLYGYDTLIYTGGPFTTNITGCPPQIIDFTSPINGGMNQILTIKGNNFGSVRGNGQVKFRNADKFGFPWLNKLDNIDYILWNDTMIQIRMPSTIDTLNTPNKQSTWTPGSGNFKVVTNAGDSAISSTNLAGNTFSVYFSVLNTRTTIIPQQPKLKANLIRSNATTGGYLLRLDTSVGNDPLKVMCIKKAIKDWACLTTVNIKLGPDTVMQDNNNPDYICNIRIVDKFKMSDTNFVAETKWRTLICNTQPPFKVISDFDIFINNKYLSKFFYDTTSAALPASKIDFLEVMYHEIGHGVGLMHVIDSSDIMYYRSLGPLSYSIPGAQRRKPMPYTSAVDGVNTQISTSAVTISGQCGFEDMVQLNAGSCSFISVEEYLKNKLNVVIYPNPSENGIFNLSFDIPDENVKPVIEIFDIVGKKIYSETLPISFNKHYSHQMNIGNTISKGMYLLVIRSGPIYASFKLIKN